jgi:putative hemolysin
MLGGVGIFLFFSMFFSSVEIALSSLSRVQIEQLIARDTFFSRALKVWEQNTNRILATILVGNTLVNTATATLATSFMFKAFPEVDIFSITALVTVVLLIFGEIIPKTIARSQPEKLSLILCRPLLVIDYFFYPVTYVLSTGLSFVLRLLGIPIQGRRGIKSGDIESMVLLATREGSVEKEKTEILSSVFQFSKRRVRDIMLPRDRISALSISSSLSEILDVVRHENHSRYPVFNGSLDRIVGFLHARDLFAVIRQTALSEDPKKVIENFSLRTCLRRAFFVSESMMISRVLHDMKSNRIHLAIVKDEWGNVVGLVTLEDILEEVFGEIDDEHDEQSTKQVVDLYSGGVEVEGSDSLVDLQNRYGIEIEPSESYSTLNGFLQHYASHQQMTPKMVIIWNKYVFAILAVKDGEVERVRITEIPSDDGED